MNELSFRKIVTIDLHFLTLLKLLLHVAGIASVVSCVSEMSRVRDTEEITSNTSVDVAKRYVNRWLP